MYDELKLYCRSEGLTEYLRSEMKISARGKSAARKAKNIVQAEKKNPGAARRAV